MSLMSTLAKVAIGFAIAKGAVAMMKESGGVTQASNGGGLGGLLGSLACASGRNARYVGRPPGGNTGGGAGGLVASGDADGLMGAFTGAMGGNAATAPAQNNSSFEFNI